MKHFVCLFTLLAVITTVHGVEPLTWEVEEGSSATLKRGEQILLTFHGGTDQPKPYFDPVAAPGGPNLAWTSPPDHPWHYGLWFSWKFINDLNYWEEDRKTGQSPGSTTWDGFTVDPRQDGSATISMDLAYRPAMETEPVLTEQRSVTIPPATGDQLILDWTSVFTVGGEPVVLNRTPLAHEPGGKSYGGYAGLSMRMAKDLTDRRLILHDGSKPFVGDRHRGPSPVAEYNGRLNGQEIGYAVLDHPDNPRHPTPWYAIASKVMSYLNAAVLCYEPMTLEPGTSFTLRYRIILHHGRWGPEELKQAASAYTN